MRCAQFLFSNFANLLKRSSFLRAFARKIFFKEALWLHSSAYALSYSSKWYSCFPPSPTNVPTPRSIEGSELSFLNLIDSFFPEAGVLELSRPLLIGEAGLILSKEGILLPDHSWYGQHVNEIRIPRFIYQRQYLKGVTLSLASEFAINNYSHFMTDCLARLSLFKTAGFSFDQIDNILLPKPQAGNPSIIFKLLGLPWEKCCWIDRNTFTLTDVLLAPSFPGVRRCSAKWALDYIRDNVLTHESIQSKSVGDLIYLSRKGYSRNPVNLHEVESILCGFGVTILSPEDYENNCTSFCRFSLVIGITGTALHSIIFCKPGTTVLELIPTDMVTPYYYAMSHFLGLNYYYLACNSIHSRSTGALGPSRSDIYVNPLHLERALQRLISS